MASDLGVSAAPETDGPAADEPPGASPRAGPCAYWTSRTGVVVLACTLLAFAIRVYTLTRPGYLTGVTEYDDGVYLGGSIRLLQGALPYRDFTFLHPPGILLLMLPAALLAKVTTTTHALAAARILTAGASAACVPLAGGLTRHRGALVTLVTCGILAVYPADIMAAHTLLLEPWMNLLLLTGACLAFRRGRLAPGRRLLWAGVAIGAAGSVKIWAGPPAVVLLVVCLLSGASDGGRLRTAGRYILGLVIGSSVPVLPFALSAPVSFVRTTLVIQAERSGYYVAHSIRLAHITGLIDFLDRNGRFSPLAGVRSVFASGAAADASAGLLPYLIALLAAIMVAAGYWLRPGRPSPLETLALATAVLTTAVITLSPVFYYHYADFCVPWIALSAGGALGALGGAFRVRRAAAGSITIFLFLLAAFQAREIYHLGTPSLSPDQAVIPAGACVVTDRSALIISANRFTAARPGCPDFLDPFGEALVLHNGFQHGASGNPEVVAGLKTYMSRADYVWLSVGDGIREPWTAWFHANFTELPTRNGDGAVFKRAVA